MKQRLGTVVALILFGASLITYLIPLSCVLYVVKGPEYSLVSIMDKFADWVERDSLNI